MQKTENDQQERIQSTEVVFFFTLQQVNLAIKLLQTTSLDVMFLFQIKKITPDEPDEGRGRKTNEGVSLSVLAIKQIMLPHLRPFVKTSIIVFWQVNHASLSAA
jgi:hypothetical protein